MWGVRSQHRRGGSSGNHWLDFAAKGLADGTHSRREILRRGAAIAAGGVLGSAATPLAALAATSKCTELTCPDGTCCEGRCLTGSLLGCCHDRIYSRLNKHCCPEAPAGGGHTCLDGLECCGKAECCEKDEICCGTGQCIPNKSGNIGCCNGFTYNKREDRCCPEHAKDEVHFCAKDESCCGKAECCKKDEICCGTGQCIPNKSGNIGCCNGFTYNKREDQCCLEFPDGEAHFCAKDETCCGEKACCGEDQECCGSGGKEHCVAKGECNECPPGEVKCGGSCCPKGQCQNGTCLCGGFVCSSPNHCCHGTQCCGGVCCHESCCVFATDQCCSNNGGCCGAKDICCPSGCCIYGCTADGGCALPPGATVRERPRRPTLAPRR
jgi:hypothetical protein